MYENSVSSLRFELGQTIRANVPSLKIGQIPDAFAENAGIPVLAENNTVALYIYLQCILFRDIQSPAQLNGQDNAPQFIHLTDDSSRFHVFLLSNLTQAAPPVIPFGECWLSRDIKYYIIIGGVVNRIFSQALNSFLIFS